MVVVRGRASVFCVRACVCMYVRACICVVVCVWVVCMYEGVSMYFRSISVKVNYKIVTLN